MIDSRQGISYSTMRKMIRSARKLLSFSAGKKQKDVLRGIRCTTDLLDNTLRARQSYARQKATSHARSSDLPR